MHGINWAYMHYSFLNEEISKCSISLHEVQAKIEKKKERFSNNKHRGVTHEEFVTKRYIYKRLLQVNKLKVQGPKLLAEHRKRTSW